MSSTALFINFIKDAIQEVKNDFKKYLSAFLGLIILANLEEAYKSVGGNEGDGGSIAIGFATIILTFVITAKIILIHKKNPAKDEKMIYVLVPFLLYSFYYSVFFFLGLVCLVIPGIWVLIFFSQAPLLAALAPSQENFFKKSIKLVKKNIKLVAWVSISSVVLEFFSLAFSPIANQKMRFLLTGIFSFPDAFLTIILTIASVKIFYYLNE
jgi:hypothetical protein